MMLGEYRLENFIRNKIFKKLENNQKKFGPKLSMRAIYSHFYIENTLVKCTVSKFTLLISSFSIIDMCVFKHLIKD